MKKKVVPTKAAEKKNRVHWNDKVAKSRNDKDWKRRIMEGKASVPMHPTILRKRRIEKGLSQSGMALEVGLSVTTYGDVERGKRPVRKETAERIAAKVKSVSSHLFSEHSKNKMIAKDLKQGE